MTSILRVLIPGAAVMLASSSRAQKATRKNAIEDKITRRIFHLPEVPEAARRVDSLSNGKRHLATLIYERPSAKSRYFKVKVVEDNGVNLVTYFQFLVSRNAVNIESIPTE